MYDDDDIVRKLKMRRLQWFILVELISDDATARKGDWAELDGSTMLRMKQKLYISEIEGT